VKAWPDLGRGQPLRSVGKPRTDDGVGVPVADLWAGRARAKRVLNPLAGTAGPCEGIKAPRMVGLQPSARDEVNRETAAKRRGRGYAALHQMMTRDCSVFRGLAPNTDEGDPRRFPILGNSIHGP
jgi:hypothetical protein